MTRTWFGNSVRSFISKEDTVARGTTDVVVGSGALLGGMVRAPTIVWEATELSDNKVEAAGPGENDEWLRLGSTKAKPSKPVNPIRMVDDL